MFASQAAMPAQGSQYYAGPFDLAGDRAAHQPRREAAPLAPMGAPAVLSPRLARLALAQRQHHQGRC